MNPDTIRELAISFQKSRILLTAVELDVFTNIDRSGSTSRQVAGRSGLNGRACERLLNALTSLGFLIKRDGQFFNTDASYTLLSRNGADYMGGLMHTSHLWKTWSNLTQVIKTGIPAHPDDIPKRGEEWLFAFINAMHDRAKNVAPHQLAKIDLAGVNSVLDIGGGSGAYSMQFVTRKPGIKVIVFDLPDVIPITRRFIDREGFSGRLKTKPGDYTVDELPVGFDIVFLSAIIHSNSPDINRKLIGKCFHSLNQNGRIIIQDWIMNKDRTQPAAGAIFAINMLVGTEAGDCYTEEEVNEMLGSAGFRDISKTLFESGLSQIIARRP